MKRSVHYSMPLGRVIYFERVALANQYNEIKRAILVAGECSVRKESTAIIIRFSVKCFSPRNVVVTCDHGINSQLFQEQSGPPVQLFRVPVVRISGKG